MEGCYVNRTDLQLGMKLVQILGFHSDHCNIQRTLTFSLDVLCVVFIIHIKFWLGSWRR
jgi:hypothetical protein